MALKILFAGSGEFGGPSLEMLDEAGHEIVHVITQPDRPAGRGRELTWTPIAGVATKPLGLPVLKTANINEEKLPPADLLVVIAFGQKIAPHVVNQPRLGAINLHASLLPRYRGAAPINWAIINGERRTGNSVIRLAQRMDAGAILGQSVVEIGELETAGELHNRLAIDGAGLLVRLVREIEKGNVVERVQEENLAVAAPKLNREAARIDWSGDAEAIARRIRGLFPWPGCRVKVGEKGNLTLMRARAVDRAGEVGVIGEDGTVGAGKGSVEIVEVLPEGKRPMKLSAYRNGHPWEAGMRVESL
ncbi:MAG TPA: methionyl-tRNA formyltransferase [Tepidisphaeraceae bacterium]|jgi:methionyl-tRNA formyltransferase|nr:methionyl-tRNA formyltransferase [Tepidisphaeraceae bacterium]